MVPLALTGCPPGHVESRKNPAPAALEARADVQRQIEILESSIQRRNGELMFGPLITDLTATLKEIEDSLADLEHDPEKWTPVFGKDLAPPIM
jgi:hypothetical protein